MATTLLVSVVALTLAAVALNRSVPEGGRVIASSRLASFEHPVRYTTKRPYPFPTTSAPVYRVVDNESGRLAERPQRILDTMALDCHGGTAHITWYVGNLEPTVPKTGIHISVLLDGRRLATLIKGGPNGIWDDGPASIHTVAPCSVGSHELAAKIDKLSGGWGIPYADAGERVQRGFVVRETLKD